MNLKLSCILVCIGLSTCRVASAGETVAVYGLIDLGLSYFSNTGTATGADKSTFRVDSGIAQSSRLGFRGSEDLGDGNAMFFNLETGFSADTGALGQNGAIFGRQAVLGIRSKRFGALSIGRQYDFMSNLGVAYAMGANSAAGSFAWGLHADAANRSILNNHIYVGDRSNNSIRYQTNDMGGFSAGLMVGLGEVAGNASAGRTVSGLAGYARGGFSMGAAFTHLRDAADRGSTRIGGFGASHVLGQVKFWGIATDVKATLTSARARTFEAGATWSLTPVIDLSGAYQYQVRNLDVGDAQALVAVLDYKLSKRSDVYLSGVYANDNGYDAYPVYGGGVQAAGGVQTALRLGLRHRF
ncbi:porin [Massilia niastensis]|uniref:porin n=1 Tax=Massilia niastensis TaxID=544911 RepID=UPI001E44E44D|nr:porin [Massilia niastensis]